MVKHKVLTELNNLNDNKYLNVPIFNSRVEDASVALTVKQQPHELGPNRLPGSKLYLSGSPGWGASTTNSTNLTITSDGGSVIIQLG